ncbi:SLBB domain-containing protein [Flavobacterium degerlachei]|jgi:protein involved in polysaccharide export with SLBB domain|uniref:Protein involved in polysaccharide export, contains SLBB domain of the beta-grasp fold n=1 Tax=Flavobacterium degerlachei TaxID=229203 RepID=A0A1H2VNW3_9FLAO|nr:SLBB domain-containing protein [Flavobacterium degerlachei]SDW69968.1 protein involved in polysaccharide export, contains SLBB domain of the beta-grasp fold [Flavobacterium degerlachei]
MRKIITVVILFLALLQTNTLLAQDLLKSSDLSTVKVDNLSDAEIANIKAQLQSNNTTIEQVEPMALAKGMSASEFAKLKLRLAANAAASGVKNDSESSTQKYGRTQEKIVNTKVKDSLNSLVFGSELFDNPTLNFEPDLKLATPMNYILGPGDELQVSVYGVQEYNANIPVSVEGKVSIQYVGQIAVAGMSIEAATQKIKAAMARVYSTIGSGQSQVSVSLGRIRTIRVTIIGSKQPGNYSISSLATVYNALFLGGGPGKNESYRNIELIRNNKIYTKVDIYKFLVNGDQSENVGLKDNDVIRIPAYEQRVKVEGQVKRPGIFEMKAGETFSDLLSFASGFNEFAYTASVNVLQKTGKEFKVQDIKASEFNSYKPQSGDVFRVTKILNRFENRIKIEGAVFRPDMYSFYEGMRISDLIAKAEGLKEDAYSKRARIIRLKSDLTKEIVNVNLEKALEGDVEADIPLLKEDIVTVYSILDFVEEYKITIDGEIKKPGVYDYQEGLTLNDLLVQAGGLTGSASKRVEVARMIMSEEIDDANPNKAELFNIEITPDNNEQAVNFSLYPFDVVNIRKMAVYEKPEMVSISGAVHYAGKYVLASKKAKVYDIVKRAGGLTSGANIEGVKIKRPIQAKQIEAVESIDLNLGTKDSIQNKLEKKLKEDLKYAIIPVDWKSIVKDENSNTNVTLFPGDEIEVAAFNEGVKVTGNVLLTSEIPYDKGKGFRYYLDAVGGVDAKGWKKKAYIIYPNGKADVASSFLFFRNYPKVTPGSQIIVPEKPEVKKMSTGEFVSIAGVLASLAGVIIAILR